MKILKSAEDYLEAVLMLKEEQGYVRSIDLAEHLGVTKPSVSYAIRQLRDNGYVTMDHAKMISLTDKGMEIAVLSGNRGKCGNRERRRLQGRT